METYIQHGDNSFSQIGDNSNVQSAYYKKMHFAYLDYEEKTVEIQESYQIDLSKLKYIFSSTNAYNNEKSYELGEIKYESLHEELITVDENGLITAKKDASGITKIKIEDITNGYETYLTVIVNRIENTDTVLYIYNVDDLMKFKNSVNSGDTYAGKTVYLMNDLDLKDVCGPSIGSWAPIGDTFANGKLTFSGTFEGNNHSIDNLYINSYNSSNQGLFGTVTNGKIMNLELKNGSISVGNIKTSSGAGAFAGAITNGTIISCINKNVTVSGGLKVGGISGSTSGKSTIKYSGNEANMTGTHSAGGIIGSMHNNSMVYSCYNYGTIKTKNSGSINNNYLAGGICGYMSSGGKNNIITISNCYNTGAIYGYTATGGITALQESAGKYYLNNNYTTRNINRER